MTTQRVWLSDWEWACCGEVFTAGDRVAFPIKRMTPDVRAYWVEKYGAGLAAAIDAVEMHHEVERLEGLEGRVTAIYGVEMDFVYEMGSGRPVPGTARLCDIPRIPWPPHYEETGAELVVSAPQLVGYLVDLECDRD